jgi:Uma2 family endonuclease
MPGSSKENTTLAGFIGGLLVAFIKGKHLGVVTTADGGYQITAKNAFQPDAAFISRGKTGGRQGLVFPVAPDIAVEVISPSESEADVRSKTRAYLAAGGMLVWNVYPETRSIDVCTLNSQGELEIQTLTEADTLTGGAVLPGFAVSVRDIFAVLEDLE